MKFISFFFTFIQTNLIYSEFLIDEEDYKSASNVSQRSGDVRYFNYKISDPYGPYFWGDHYPQCESNRQSPIDIYGGNCKVNSKSLTITRLHDSSDRGYVSNNGHSFFIKLEYADDIPATFIDNGLEVPYIVNSVHFHWGENDQKGSEHKLFGKSYAGEAHVIAYNSKYESLMEAKDKPDGFAVLAVLYELGDFTQNRLFFEYTRHVLEADERVPFVVNKLSLQDIVKLPRNGHHMSTFNYDGSLTTPPCTENVRWMIVESSSKITPYDLINLRKLKDLDGKNIKTNHRPIQDIYDREIEC